MPDASPGHMPSARSLPIDVERDVVQRAAGGDQGAIGQLYDAYVEPLYRFCVARTGNETDAEDLAEEIFLKVMRAIGGFEWRVAARPANAARSEGRAVAAAGSVDGDAAAAEHNPFRAWLFRIARNHVVSHYRREAVRGGAGEVPEWLPDQRMGPAEQAERALAVEEVFAAVAALPTAQREVIRLRFGAGLSIAETAAALDKQQTNVKVLQHKGVKRLREILEAQAASVEQHRMSRRR